MSVSLLLVTVIIFAGVFLNNVSDRIGMPVLLAFILLGMFFGSDGYVKIPFENFEMAGTVCSLALVLIMFYGGFTTSWEMAKPVSKQAVILASLGVVMTAGLTGVFVHFVTGLAWNESFLIGSVIGSTDAASVFSILRARRLNLKYNTASLLEMESGSNDPCSYMCTALCIASLTGAKEGLGLMMFQQIFFGVGIGAFLAWLFRKMCFKIHFATDGFDMLFLTGVALASYALPELVGGNGYLAAYIVGIVLGNSELDNKSNLVAYFDGVTGIVQLLIFFLLGLLAFPSRLPGVAPLGLGIALFLTFIARPLTVYLLLKPFHAPKEQILIVSWAGLRGAASIVFAIMAVRSVELSVDLYHVVFFIVLFSILFQGSLLPVFSRKLDLIDDNADVMKTFTDYQREVPVRFVETTIPANHPWCNKPLNQIIMPPKTLVVLLKRNEENIVPNGKTILQEGDRLILSAIAAKKQAEDTELKEIIIEEDSLENGKMIKELPKKEEALVILVERDGNAIIPNGDLLLQQGDILVLCNRE